LETLAEALLERVDKLIEAQRSHQPLLSTTATSVAIAELVARTEGLEHALREVAAEVQRLSAPHES
jgi:predicted sugar kinase